MEIINMPRPMRWVWGSLGAYWLADMINPGFFSIAIMALLMIPVLILDLYYPPQTTSEEKPTEEEAVEESEPETDEDAAEVAKLTANESKSDTEVKS